MHSSQLQDPAGRTGNPAFRTGLQHGRSGHSGCPYFHGHPGSYKHPVRAGRRRHCLRKPGDRSTVRPGCHGYRHGDPGNRRPDRSASAGHRLSSHPDPGHAGRQ